MTRAVERLWDDARFLDRFRREPARALRRYRLGSAQIEAIKEGSAASLSAHGVDVAAIAEGRRTTWGRIRRTVLTVGAVVAGLQFFGGTARARRFEPVSPHSALREAVNLVDHKTGRHGIDIRETTDLPGLRLRSPDRLWPPTLPTTGGGSMASPSEGGLLALGASLLAAAGVAFALSRRLR